MMENVVILHKQGVIEAQPGVYPSFPPEELQGGVLLNQSDAVSSVSPDGK